MCKYNYIALSGICVGKPGDKCIFKSEDEFIIAGARAGAGAG